MHRTLAGIALLPLLAACMVGTPARQYRVAVEPQGVRSTLRLQDKTTLTGELLAASDSGLLIRTIDSLSASIAVVRYSALRSGRFRQIGDIWFDGRSPGERVIDRLRLASRFPQGVSLDLLDRLRAAYGQPLEQFLDAARRGTAVFHDRDAAFAAGYRPVGPESPSMGRHWVHPALLIAGIVDPARPQILSYAEIGGRPVLVGIAYAVLAGDSIPKGPAPRGAWHVHDGTIREEALQADHDAHPARAGGRDEGVAVLHAWIYVANPAGTFASDNWSLPFLRAGLAPPAEETRDAARAVALAIDSGTFFAGRLPHRGDAARSPPLPLAARADSVRQWLDARATGPLTPDEIAWLTRLWRSAWEEAVRND